MHTPQGTVRSERTEEPKSVLGPLEIIPQIPAIFESSSFERNGKPRKNPFFKALATVRQLMGVAPEDPVPDEVYHALCQAANAHTTRSQGGEVVGERRDSQHWSLKRARQEVPKIYSDSLKELNGRPPVIARIASVRLLKQRMGIAENAGLPPELTELLVRLEQKNPNRTAPVGLKASPKQKGARKKKAPKPKRPVSKKNKNPPATRSFRGRFQELPERSVWTGAPWDHSFAEYRWR